MLAGSISPAAAVPVTGSLPLRFAFVLNDKCRMLSA